MYLIFMSLLMQYLMKKLFYSLLTFGCSFFTASTCQAAYNIISQGDGINYAIWDIFGSSSTFSGLTPNSSAGGYTTATLSSTTTGAIMAGGGDRIYGFSFSGAAVPHDLTLTASYVPTASNLLMLQIALGEPTDVLLGPDGETRSKNYFTVSLNGEAPNDIILLDTTFAGTPPNTSTYHNWGYIWDTSTLNLTAGSALNFVLDGFDFTSGHVSVDAIALSAVPEPSRAALGVTGLVLLLMRRKRNHRYSNTDSTTY